MVMYCTVVLQESFAAPTACGHRSCPIAFLFRLALPRFASHGEIAKTTGGSGSKLAHDLDVAIPEKRPEIAFLFTHVIATAPKNTCLSLLLKYKKIPKVKSKLGWF